MLINEKFDRRSNRRRRGRREEGEGEEEDNDDEENTTEDKRTNRSGGRSESSVLCARACVPVRSLSLVLRFLWLYVQEKVGEKDRESKEERKGTEQNNERAGAHTHAHIHTATKHIGQAQPLPEIHARREHLLVKRQSSSSSDGPAANSPQRSFPLIMYEMGSLAKNGFYPPSSSRSSPDSLKHQQLLVPASVSPAQLAHPYFPALAPYRFQLAGGSPPSNSNGSSEIHSSSSSTASSHDQLHSWFVAQSCAQQQQSMSYQTRR